LALKLPRKTERVEVLELAPGERELYDFFKRRSHLLIEKVSESDAKAKMASKSDSRTRKRRQGRVAAKDIPEATRRKGAGNIIVLISVLRMICDHGEALLPSVALDAWRNRDAGAVSWAVLEMAAKAESSCCVCGQSINGEGDKQESNAIGLTCTNKHKTCEACVAAVESLPTTPECPKCSAAADVPSALASPHRNVIPAPRPSPSSKVSAIMRNVLSGLQNKDSVINTDLPVKRHVSLQAS
jgi:SNF2 family DNA or RNA helicase